jgi:hypothetical protein
MALPCPGLGLSSLGGVTTSGPAPVAPVHPFTGARLPHHFPWHVQEMSGSNRHRRYLKVVGILCLHVTSRAARQLRSPKQFAYLCGGHVALSSADPPPRDAAECPKSPPVNHMISNTFRRVGSLGCAVVFVMGAILVPSSLQAQFGIEGLITQLNEIRFYTSCWNTQDPLSGDGGCPRGKRAFGVEALYRLKPIAWKNTRYEPLRPKNPKDPMADTTGGTVKCDDTNKCERTATFVSVKPDSAPMRAFLVQLGVSYSQFSGFSIKTPGVEIRGAARELPAVSLYASAVVRDSWLWLKHLNPMVGVHSGLIQLSNLSAYTAPDGGDPVSYIGSGTTVQLGASAGATLKLGSNMHVYYTGGAYYRKFPGVQWTTQGSNRVPVSLPRTVNFSGFSQVLGVQIGIRNPMP